MMVINTFFSHACNCCTLKQYECFVGLAARYSTKDWLSRTEAPFLMLIYIF